MLKLINIKKSYESTLACSDINLTIEKGEFFTLLGPSGCGKTTLLRLIAGFINPEEGEIFLKNKNITNLPSEKRGIGMVFQNYALFPHMNVYENVAYGLRVKKTDKISVEKKVDEYLNMVHMIDYKDRKISELSGGEQQRIALARSLVTEPEVLLLDEPFSNLDAKLKDNMRNELKELQRALGVTTIFVTHDQREALNLSDRIAIFENGKCIQQGKPMEVYLKPSNKFVAEFVGENNIFEVKNLPWKISNIYGDNNYLSVRPQDIFINGNNSTENFCQGIIKNIKINGELLEYFIEIIGNKDVKVIELNRGKKSLIYNIGDKVNLTIDENSLNAFYE